MYSNQPDHKDAFQKAVVNYREQLRRFAAMKVKDEDQADMIVTDVFLKIFLKKIQINQPGGPGPLLYTMVERASIDFQRHRKVEESRFREYVLYQRGCVEHASIVEEDSRERQQSMELDLLSEEITQLPPKSKEVLTRYYFGTTSMKDLAIERGVSESSIRNLIAFARRRLKRRIEGAKLCDQGVTVRSTGIFPYTTSNLAFPSL